MVAMWDDRRVTSVDWSSYSSPGRDCGSECRRDRCWHASAGRPEYPDFAAELAARSRGPGTARSAAIPTAVPDTRRAGPRALPPYRPPGVPATGPSPRTARAAPSFPPAKPRSIADLVAPERPVGDRAGEHL